MGHHAEYSVLGGVERGGGGGGGKGRLLVNPHVSHNDRIGGNIWSFGQVAPYNSRLYMVK